jgi:hypothetical protein
VARLYSGSSVGLNNFGLTTAQYLPLTLLLLQYIIIVIMMMMMMIIIIIIIESNKIKVQNIFNVENKITGSTNCKYRTAATLYTLEVWSVSGIYL